jgi:hypothetical protein
MHDYAVAFQRLQEDLPKTDNMLTSDMSLSEAEALWLRKSFLKKFEDVKNEDADAKALKLFLQSNEDCRRFALTPKNLFEDVLIGEVKSLIDSYFYSGPDLTLDLLRISEGFAPGPGASRGVVSDNFYTKLFDSNLSCTSDLLYRRYRSAISCWPTWHHAEIARKNHHGLSLVEGNRLSFVPKTSEISRTICTEPNLNMLFQKGIGAFLEHQLLRRWRISMSFQQGWNRWLARRGSVDCSFGTIDLSSASDSVSLGLLRELLPPYVYRWLIDTRSPSVTLPGGQKVELHMVSSMGNAFTFPLQTILFASIVVACYRTMGILRQRSFLSDQRFEVPPSCSSSRASFGVFGDDIIVRKDSYAFVVRALELFGFRVNVDKSFNTGYFRESCGGDYYHGYDIRGVYMKHLSTSADVYSIINRLVRWSARSGIMLFRTIRYLRDQVDFLPVPWDAGDAEGIKVPTAPAELPRDRWTGGVRYRYLSQRPLSFSLPSDADESRFYPSSYGKKKIPIFFNPDGLLVSFVGGYIRNGRTSVRSDRARFKIRHRITSSWGYPDAVGSLNSRGHSWKAVAETLLNS